MKSKEYYLALVGEEANEVAQSASRITHSVFKGLRFGLHDVNPKTGRSNKDDLIQELNDLEAVVQLLRDTLEATGESFDGWKDPIAIQAKRDKVLAWAHRSVNNGTLTPDTSSDS